ncbi:MAG: UDP-N-acetylmuramoyl-L-alanine--D-glutamate ligase [Hahellaceae bacterium]|nr:UDP-N-acetylmuramoyl-L-alanine--D-glutamate ligase [Hahellaceae bacterium]
MKMLASDKTIAVVGLGITGLSSARYLTRKGASFCVMDSRENPPGLVELKALNPDVRLHVGGFRQDWLADADEIWLSPGIALDHPEILRWKGQKLIRGDVDVFAEEARAPIVAITGSNGKSTVTTLVGEMAAAAGVKVKVGGNLGTAVLDLLSDEAELYVVELSSFQLETTRQLNASAATILNLSQDHMDRYPDMLAYHRAKIRIFFGCRQAIMNKQDALAQGPLAEGVKVTWFTSDKPGHNEYGLLADGEQIWLAKGNQKLLDTAELKIKGAHNWLNALAALALAEAVSIPLAASQSALKAFKGLTHRCEWVAEKSGVTYFNDSKATNVGAALAALHGFSKAFSGRLFLIAGGQGKNQDFRTLHKAINQQVSGCILMGIDAEQIATGLVPAVRIARVAAMDEAVAAAAAMAQPGDVVLLSPACASLDMFQDYQARGESFRQAVEALC